VQGDLFRAEIKPNLSKGNLLLCSHGFNMHFGQVLPPEGVDARLSRRRVRGISFGPSSKRGPASLRSSPSGPARQIQPASLLWLTPKEIGGTRGGVIETSFAEETETDLFGEQVVLCGGVSALVKAAFETLVEAGYQPEMAYFECMHELKLIVDLMYQGGLNYMRYSISNTAEFGDYTRGPRIVTDENQGRDEENPQGNPRGAVREGGSSRTKANQPTFQAIRRRERSHPIEVVASSSAA